MFCPRCGAKNPGDGKFCRSCGNDLSLVSAALTGNFSAALATGEDGRAENIAAAITSIFTGMAFFAVSIILAVTETGRNWWFWLLIPAFVVFGHGFARLVRLKAKKAEEDRRSADKVPRPALNASINVLDPQPANFDVAEFRYSTGGLAPLSVTDGTTRDLEIDGEGQTIPLNKKNDG
jgi:hypothetical protein